ncbi:hypothetical protein P9112_005385 [Eukaryota sp. TZLM1-RC]
MSPFHPTQELCYFCFDSLRNYLDQSVEIRSPSFPNDSFSLFVTWTKRGSLRGCIGTFKAQPLHDTLKQYSIISSQQDSRFPPIKSSELSDLEVCVSLLVQYEDASGPFDWEIGKHGIIVQFNVNSIKYHATFLPEVAEDQGWDKKTTLAHLVAKSGFYGKLDDILDHLTIVRYQSVKVKCSYQDYVESFESC